MTKNYANPYINVTEPATTVGDCRRQKIGRLLEVVASCLRSVAQITDRNVKPVIHYINSYENSISLQSFSILDVP